MAIAIYPGTFDPITYGHLNILDRVSEIFERVYIVVANNPSKKPIFDAKTRKRLIQESLSGMNFKDCVEVVTYKGLIVDAAAYYKASVIVRGIRTMTDMEKEFQMAQVNRSLCFNKPYCIDTAFFMPDDKFMYVSSSMVRELAKFGQDVSEYTTNRVAIELKKYFGDK